MFNRFGAPRVAAVYHDDYVLGLDPTGPGRIHDPQRPHRVQHALKHFAYRRRVKWLEAPLATMAELERVHPETYLEHASQPTFIGEVLGLGNVQPWETEYWISLQRTVGGTVAAARHALATGLPTFNLSGGFHHAWPKRAAGFCIVNDVAVAVAALRADGFDRPIAVVDLDYHHGDGTEACLLDDHRTFTLSLHPKDWFEPIKDESIRRIISTAVSDEAYLAEIDAGLAALAAAVTPAFVFYIAGADPAAGDALCDMRITPAGMLRRDLRVAAFARRHAAPLAVVPAGGYGLDAWRPLAAFAQALAAGKEAA